MWNLKLSLYKRINSKQHIVSVHKHYQEFFFLWNLWNCSLWEWYKQTHWIVPKYSILHLYVSYSWRIIWHSLLNLPRRFFFLNITSGKPTHTILIMDQDCFVAINISLVSCLKKKKNGWRAKFFSLCLWKYNGVKLMTSYERLVI